MHRPNQIHMLSFEAAQDLSTKQFHFVKLNSVGKIVLCEIQGEEVFGVLQNKAKMGETANVVVTPGGSTVIAAEAIATDQNVMTGIDGRAVLVKGPNPHVAGKCRRGGVAAGDMIDIDVKDFAANLGLEMLTAGEDLSNSQYHYVKRNAAGNIIECDAAGERVYGILQNAPANGGVAIVARDPAKSDVEIAAAVTVGQALMTAADGRATPETGADVYTTGSATVAGAAVGDVIPTDLRVFRT